ncbi:MAG: DUF262 domain-containing HNH endonuclease family protein [Prevotellaceae bacterium]|jgi:uncharacterized protein with ParB-like and HNH nuclease domain|nr:DUF262 domain-containing HNH endonuclease family protein [Prevotellaceae bacterium]
MTGIQDTATQNFGSLIRSRNRYIVPKFQRDYSWSEEQWDDLWQDINQMMSDDISDHYMGYLVLQTANNEDYSIIDGQQRFTTITMIILAAIKAIKYLAEAGNETDQNNQRVDALMHTYIGNIDSISLSYDNFLILNRNNNNYYKDYIVKLGELRSRKITTTEKLMKQCFEWYEGRIKDKFTSGEEYAGFIKNMVNNLFFTVITVSDEMNAFRVFETLNARGVQLSSSDLLKNYLFSLVDKTVGHDGKLDELEEKWYELNKNLGAEKLPDFLRYYWNSQHKTVRSGELFKAVRTTIKEPSQVYQLLNELLIYSDVYIALKSSTDEYWENDIEIEKNIDLLQLFGLRQPYSLLMVANRKLEKSVFKQVLKDTIIISFRYNVICGLNPNKIEEVYNNTALHIVKTQSYNSGLLKGVYVGDNEFEAAFRIKAFASANAKNKKLLRYILGKIEHFISGNAIDIRQEDCTIEHIMPQSPNDDWDLDDDDIDRLSSRLGNLCLLERSLNREAGNKDYQTKVALYHKSSFITTKRIAEQYNSQWNETTIASRQQQMSKKAKDIWKI